MVKKGKDKSGGSSSAKVTAQPAEGDFIVFTNATKDTPSSGSKGKKKSSTNDGTDGKPGSSSAPAAQDGPPKPTVKQIIGGSSWTGKLPVNLLSEHCQKQKWERPDYDTRKLKEGYSVLVTLSSKNGKTGDVVKLEPFKLPPSHVHLAFKPTALEAKHFAATYALFRVCSMKNLHMTLPPDYRSLWKDFEALKKLDVADGKAWLYEADPFTALREREEAKAAAEKKRKEQQAAREKAASMPGAAGLAMRSHLAGGSGPGSGSGSASGFDPMKGWTSAPRIEMGSRMRAQVEDLLRQKVVWNPHGIEMAEAEKKAVTAELKGLGFRESHVEEAAAECRDRQETLEWLLIHVPEDDVPRWALPENYTAGVTVGATDLRREAAIKRLSQPGYSVDLCKRVFDASDGDEGRAAETLQSMLLASGADDGAQPPPADPEDGGFWGTADECWLQETASLESVFGEQYSRPSADVCQIRLTAVANGPAKDVETAVQFRRAPHYPAHVIVSVVAALPAYIKLSVIKKALAYMAESLRGEEMKIYFVADWIQQHINDIIERPGALRDVSAVASAASEPAGKAAAGGRRARASWAPRTGLSWAPDETGRQAWLRRQQDPAYRKMLVQRQRLPAWAVREALVQTVKDHQVTIVSGETGSGKSTQAVQFVLDDLYDRGLGAAANMVVTQPRRISALGLADRVSEERCCAVGSEVGYTIRGENRTAGARTKITFVTTGVLLRRLQTSGGRRIDDVVASLADVSHVVLDEVHERSLDTDFLLTILRDVLRRRADLKLVLMSATLDGSAFRDYFVAEGLRVGAVEIAGRTFPVEDFYLDDVIRETGFGLDGAFAPPAADDAADPVAKAIQKLGSRTNYGLVAATARAIDEELDRTDKPGGILIFLPGVGEINQACNALRTSGGAHLHVLPLHASLDTREQRRVFAPAPAGRRKVVVATNVAETSITIDDIVAVVDSGRVKQTSLDAQTGATRLDETWASLAACRQRRGRAGRVRPGACWKLYTRNLEQQMPDRPEPEMRRVPLEQLCLSVRAMGLADVAGFLARAPSPPDTAAVGQALDLLARMGVLDGSGSGASAGELTALGRHVAAIPADLRCAKLMVLGAVFGCLDDAVAMAAVLSSRSPFVNPPPDRRAQAREARARFSRARSAEGDLLTDLRAFRQWEDVARSASSSAQRQQRAFCDDNFLSHQSLSDIASARTQYYSALAEIGLVSFPLSIPSASASSTPAFLLRALTAAAFSPQIARVQLPDKKFATSVSGAVEIDPDARTIRYFSRDSGRVFIHPSSILFDDSPTAGQQQTSTAFLSYFSIVSTSKVFVRQLTPFNIFTLLLFSGAPIRLDTLGRGLVVDNWLRLRGWARIGVLISRLRAMVDDVIALKMQDPALDLADNDVIKTVVKLIELDGLDA